MDNVKMVSEEKMKSDFNETIDNIKIIYKVCRATFAVIGVYATYKVCKKKFYEIIEKIAPSEERRNIEEADYEIVN